MSKCYKESGLCFEFDDDLKIIKYDEYGGFYRDKVLRCFCDLKAVDFICQKKSELWFLEVKNFSENDRTKPITVADEFIEKVKDTITGIATMCYITNGEDRKTFQSLICARKIHLVLHCNLDKHLNSKELVTRQRNLQDQLRKKLRAIDCHLKVTSTDNPVYKLPWRTSVPKHHQVLIC